MRRLNILFVMRHTGYIRNFESTLRMLCDRGHCVHLATPAAGPHVVLDTGDVTQELCDRYPRFSRGVIPVREDAWAFVAREMREALDYLRFLTPPFRDAPKLRARAQRDAPAAVIRLTEQGLFSGRLGPSVFLPLLRTLHRAIPTDVGIDAFLDAHRPDLLVVTPLIERGAPQAEYLRSARARGIPTALCVASWDNLTNKGLIHGPVDVVTVWNEAMKREAVELHGVPADRVVVTGAQPFDHWFEQRPSGSRAEFCARVGLPPERPYVLYLCSSKFIAPDEVPFVRAWLRQLRQSPTESLSRASVLVRPHPQNADQWQDVDLRDFGPIAIWPQDGQVPNDQASRADYFDSMYHSAAVVAVNTTAAIESAIVGRRVYTVLVPEFRETQEGTLHFDHLRREHDGLLHVADTMADHIAQLDAAIRDSASDDARCRRFVDTFVRPYGVTEPATPRLVAALETAAKRRRRERGRRALWALAVGPALERRGERLQYEALLAEEQKAARRAAKRMPPKAAAAPAAASAKGAMQLTWGDLARAYRKLNYEARRRCSRRMVDKFPGEFLLDAIKPERLDYPHADIYLRITTRSERNRLTACSKEPFTVEWIHRFIGPGEVLYDVGANVGAYSLVAAKKPGGGARVYAFEASYTNVASICANVLLNDVADLVTPVPVALANATAPSVFNLRALEPGSARHTLGDGPSPEGPTLYRQPILTFSLDELVERFGFAPPNHIKLDVDGGELAVLEGAARTLSSPSLRSILVEVSMSLSQAVTDVLATRGLTLEEKVNVRNNAGEYRVWYGLFTRQPHESRKAEDVSAQLVSR